MNPIISILHATFGRPKKAITAMRQWHERADNPGLIEYILSVEENDPSFAELKPLLHQLRVEPRFSCVGLIMGRNLGSAGAWNQAAMRAAGSLLIQAQDDVTPPEHWDSLLLARLPDNWSDSFIFVAVGDGYRKDRLCCTAIMTKKRMEQEGHFLCPEFISVFSDDDVTYRAIRDARAGECKWIDARDLIFRHDHHYHCPAKVEWDATYARENSPEAYERGRKLFFERNPEAATDGLRNWA